MISKTLKQKIMFTILRLALLFPLGFLFWIIGDIIVKGIWKFTEPGFLITTASADYLSGGILAAIIGSLYLIIFTIIFSLPIGVLGAIYLSEYAKENWLTRIIRRTLTTLAGVPSIVFGIFGYGLFALSLRLGVNIISASLTLALLVIPVITTGSVEALKAVPKDYREAALSLGASKWMAIKDHVIPNAISGIATSSILGLSRAIGETAPILFMAIMWSNTVGGIFDKFVALPVLVYQLLTQSTNTVLTLPIAYGAALTLLLLAVLINIFAIYLRIRHRRKLAMIRGS